jgi:hypothetical protein
MFKKIATVKMLRSTGLANRCGLRIGVHEYYGLSSRGEINADFFVDIVGPIIRRQNLDCHIGCDARDLGF